MSATSRRTVYVGLFVAIAVAIFGAAILAVGALQNAFSPKIAVHAVFGEVGGLQSGDTVMASGMRVGVVEELSFLEASKVDVALQINTADAPFIPADSVATIGSDGLIGNPTVVLSGGTQGSASIQDGDVLSIGESVSTTDIMATLQENNTNLVAITSDVKALTSKLRAGEGTLGRLLNEDDLYVEVQTALADIKAASASAKELTASLARFSRELSQPGQLPHDLVNDTEIMPSVRAAVSNLEGTAAKASELVAGLTADMDNPTSPVGVLLSDAESGADLKETLANLEQATVLLNEDLVAIRSNFLFRPYFKKQEREAKKEAKRKEKEAKQNP